jgi:hypothetical protein
VAPGHGDDRPLQSAVDAVRGAVVEGNDPVAVVTSRHVADGSAAAPGLDDPITDDELTALALAADPDSPLDPQAVPLSVYLAQVPGLLPQWYMPQATASCGSRWRTSIILAVIFAFVLIEAWGLCSTYGQVVLA